MPGLEPDRFMAQLLQVMVSNTRNHPKKKKKPLGILEKAVYTVTLAWGIRETEETYYLSIL